MSEGPTRTAVSDRRSDERPASDRLGAALLALIFACLSLAEHAAVMVYFRRLRVMHRERFPSRGAVLLVANHPATWTDVLVLDVALGRKLHFLAEDRLYRNRAGAALLVIHGALPVASNSDSCGARERNAETFRRCHELFDRGEVVAVFPEGVSVADRSVLVLKTGSARIALGYQEPRSVGRGLALITVGIHYASRTSFRSDVTVSVGERVELEPYRLLTSVDPEAACHALTEQMHRALSALILDLPEPALVAAVTELESLTAESAGTGARELESAKRIAARLERMRISDTARLEDIRRHTRAYRRARAALGLSDRSLRAERHAGAWRHRTGPLTALCVLGALPAAAGAILHAVPWGVGEIVAHRVAPEPSRISFARIAAGLVLLPVNYALMTWGLVRGLHIPVSHAAAGLIAIMALGLWTLSYRRWARALWERVRFAALERSHPRLIGRARSEQRALIDFLGLAASEVETQGISRAEHRETP